MEFYISKIYYKFYFFLALFVFFGLAFITWDSICNKEKGYILIVLILLFFLSISIYFYLKSINKKPFIIIDDEKFLIVGKSKSYNFINLHYYRHEKIFVKTSIEYIHFYDKDKNRIFYINITDIDNNEVLLNLIGQRITQLN